MIYESTTHMQNSRLMSALRAQPQRPKRYAPLALEQKNQDTSRHAQQDTTSHIIRISEPITWCSQKLGLDVAMNNLYHEQCRPTAATATAWTPLLSWTLALLSVQKNGTTMDDWSPAKSSQWIWRSRLMLCYAMQSSHHICSSVAIGHIAWIGLCQSLSSCTYRNQTCRCLCSNTSRRLGLCSSWLTLGFSPQSLAGKDVQLWHLNPLQLCAGACARASAVPMRLTCMPLCWKKHSKNRWHLNSPEASLLQFFMLKHFFVWNTCPTAASATFILEAWGLGLAS